MSAGTDRAAPAAPPAPAGPAAASAARTPWWASGWPPGALAVAVTILTLHWYGVSARDLAAFGAYTVLAGTLPGTLWWRAMIGRAGALAVDAAAGTAVGFAVEIPVYLVARAAGVPLAVLAWPVVTIVVFVAVPAMRRHWRGSGERMPAGVSWALAGFGLYVLMYSAVGFFRVEGLSGAAGRSPYVDMPFQIALIGELKHHFPGTMPYVTGSPLQYHWYVHAHGAAASWITGIEPQVLILRLLPLPVIAAAGLLVAGIGRSLTARWWPGVLALFLVCFGTIANPYGWTGGALIASSALGSLWLSPTQTFGDALFAATVLVLVDILRRERAGAGRWIAYALLTGAVAGAKATFLPLLVCGLLAAVAVGFTRSGAAGSRRPLLGMLGIVAAWLVFAQLGLYGGGDGGMSVAPLATTKFTQVGKILLGSPSLPNPWTALAGIAVLSLVALGAGWAGLAGLAGRATRADPSVWVLLGVGAASVGATYAFGHPGLSQVYFLISGLPYIAIASAVGFAALADARRTRGPDAGRSSPGRRWSARAWIGIAAVCGVVAVYLTRAIAGRSAPERFRGFVAPYAVLALILAAVGLVAWLVARRTGQDRAVVTIALLAMLVATTLPTAWTGLDGRVTTLVSAPMRDVVSGAPSIPAGGIVAARWLRAHSGADDMVATNEHCRIVINSPRPCDSRDFWLSAFAERRVLVEGWSYTERSDEAAGRRGSGSLGTTPYNDPALLAANDAVFYQPTAADVATLADSYHIRWLVAVGTTDPALDRYATVRFHAGHVTVYEITR